MSAETVSLTGSAAPSVRRAPSSRWAQLTHVFSRWRWSALAIFGVAAAVWAPRLTGPVDLRYDGGVYYVLGTSLAEGQGYRLLNEPGAPEDVQYPPLLPAFIALHQKALGTSDVAVVAPVLRVTYAVLYVALALALLALARAFLPPLPALGATVLATLQFNTLLLSDMLFTEVPFALLALGLVAVLRSPRLAQQTGRRETAAWLLAGAAFLLRTAGIALLATWVLEAIVRRRWRLALVRAALAAVPFGAWQLHVAHVRASDAYQHPAYAYQRAPYQFYNVTYAENMALANPFRPEAGRVTPRILVGRLWNNLTTIPTALGESVSAPHGFWRWASLGAADYDETHDNLPNRVARFPLVVLSALVITGLVVPFRRREWAFLLLVALSVALVCTTPWPGQFSRYLIPVSGLLAIALVLGARTAFAALRARRARPGCRWGRLALAGLFCVVAFVQAFTIAKAFRYQHSRGFFFDGNWSAWSHAAQWVATHAPPDAIVATAVPHLLYLQSGLHAIFPPFEPDTAYANQLLRDVPVSYVIVDSLDFLDVSRRYALPAVTSDPAAWECVHQVGRTSVYARRAPAASSPLVPHALVH